MRVRRTSISAAVVALMAGMLLVTPAARVAASGHQAHAAVPGLVNYIASSGIRTPEFTYSGMGIDIDRDTDQDIFISNHTRGGSLWRNNSLGRFAQTATYAWPKYNPRHQLIDRHDCVWADVDRNGRVDAYCTTGRTMANYVKTGRGNELWLQDRTGHFVNQAPQWNVDDVCGRGRVVRFVNANGDAYPDLVVANARGRAVTDPCDSDPDLPNERTKLFLNHLGRYFRYVPTRLPVPAGAGVQCVVPLDFNGDGWQDLYLCQQLNEAPMLFENHQGHGYVNVTAEHRLTGLVSDAAATDLDGDGDPDLVIAAAHDFQYQLNDAGVFGDPVEIAAVPAGGEGWAVAVGDIDGDGDTDVYGMVGDYRLLTNPNDVIFYRDGLSFTSAPVPHAGGLADDVVMVHPWRNGQTGILVLNGYNHCCGPNAHKLGPIALFRLDG